MNATPTPTRQPWIGRIWLTYWALLFTVTHIPPGQAGKFSFDLPDWLLHGVTYGALAALTLWALQQRLAGTDRRRIPPVRVFFWIAVLMFYGAFDEWTQPLFDRHCELRDWLADMIGVAAGLALGAVWRPLRV